MRTFLSLFILLLSTTALAQPASLPQWALGPFTRPAGANPMISPIAESEFDCPMRQKTVRWECADTFNPAAVVYNNKVVVLYRAEDDPSAGIGGRTSRIGYAESADGIHVDYRLPQPVHYPDGSAISREYEWTGGIEDPRVVEARVNGERLFVMTHTSWNNRCPRLSVSTSKDLKHWTHCGPAFAEAYGGKFLDLACKSGSIVTRLKHGRLVATKVKVNGKKQYLMYWGEEYVAAATSDDLVHWTPVTDERGELLLLARPRDGHFDSMLTECGPPAVMTRHGIVLLYNGKNRSDDRRDERYPSNTYSAGQMLFAADSPLTLVDRLDTPFFRPTEDFEKTGQYAAGTVFIQGLVHHHRHWLLYYGCADSFVAVATAPR